MGLSRQHCSSQSNSFDDQLLTLAARIDGLFDELLGNQSQLDLVNRYSVLGGGKRFRAFLTFAVAECYRVDREQSLRIGAAVELVHAYSLIHDDLPSMDNADTRRGKPSCHVKHGEAAAILAGDSLTPLAFEVMVSPLTHPDAEVRIALVKCLAEASGPRGMPLGQMMDLGYEGKIDSAASLIELERLKTGELMACACALGAILGQAPKQEIEAFRSFGQRLGLVFQIVDDLLDVTGTQANLGKPTNQDQNLKKTTFLSFLGVEGARDLAKQYTNEALNCLSGLPLIDKTLENATHFALSRMK